MTHICVSKLTIIGSDNGLSPNRCQAIIWNNAGILLIGPLGTKFSEIWIEIQIFSFKKMHLKISSAKWRPFCFGLNVLLALLSVSHFTPFWLTGIADGWQNDKANYCQKSNPQVMMTKPNWKLSPCWEPQINMWNILAANCHEFILQINSWHSLGIYYWSMLLWQNK